MSHVYDFLGPEGWGSYEVNFEGGIQAERVHRPAESILVPAFVDCHIHGAYGVDFMSATSEEMLTLCRALERDGYEFFLPTTITDSAAAIKRAISILPDHPMIAGIHLEGPFVSATYPGAQPKEKIADIPVGGSEWSEIFEGSRLRLITLAPEIPHALDLILSLQKRGVVVSMGHSDATFDQAHQAFEFGATHVTHLYNAMRPFHHREAGLVGFALLTRGVMTEVIYDLKHMTFEAMRLAERCKGPDQIIGISDCTMAAGLAPGTRINMWGHECITGPGEVRLLDGTLAGSGQTLIDIFRNLYRDFGPELAVKACSLNPRRQLDLPEPKVYLEFSHSLELKRRIPC